MAQRDTYYLIKSLGEGGSLALLFVIGYVTTAAIMATRLNAPTAIVPAVMLYAFGVISVRYGWLRHRWLVFASTLFAAALGVVFALAF